MPSLDTLADPLTLVVGLGICLAGAVAYLGTLKLAGTLLGAGAGLSIGTTLLRAFGQDAAPAMALGGLAIAALLGGWLGLAIAKKANWMAIALVGAAFGLGAAALFLRGYGEVAPEGSLERLGVWVIVPIACGGLCAAFQRPFLMLASALLGSVVVATSFNPFLGPAWLLALVAFSLAAQTLLSLPFRKRARASDDD